MTDLPPPPPPDDAVPDDPPVWPTAPPPPSTAPPAPGAPQPVPARPGPTPTAWRGVALAVAIFTVLALVGLLAASMLVREVTGSGTFTAHVDRANDYLDTVRGDRPAAAAMLCPGAEVAVVADLAATTGQYLSSFDVDGTRGTVTGEVTFADGSTRSVVLLTEGPTFPDGPDPAAEVCIDGALLD